MLRWSKIDGNRPETWLERGTKEMDLGWPDWPSWHEALVNSNTICVISDAAYPPNRQIIPTNCSIMSRCRFHRISRLSVGYTARGHSLKTFIQWTIDWNVCLLNWNWVVGFLFSARLLFFFFFFLFRLEWKCMVIAEAFRRRVYNYFPRYLGRLCSLFRWPLLLLNNNSRGIENLCRVTRQCRVYEMVLLLFSVSPSSVFIEKLRSSERWKF